MLLRDSLEEFSSKLKEQVLAFSGAFTFPIKAEMFEEIVSRHALTPMGIANIWNPGSHKQGTDIDLPSEELFFSVKSAKVSGVNKQPMSISSFRTTKYGSLDEKLSFIDGDGKNFSHYFVLARKEKETKEKVLIERKYTALIVPADQFLAKNMTWKETKSGWESEEKYDGEIGYAMRIQKKMSDQLWIYCDFKKLKKDPNVKVLFSVTIPAEQLGNTHEIVRRAA